MLGDSQLLDDLHSDDEKLHFWLENRTSYIVEHNVLGRNIRTQTHVAANLLSWRPIILIQCDVGVVTRKTGSFPAYLNKSR